MAKVNMIEMLPQEFQAAIDRNPIMYVPCGLVEWHARHMPLGNDGLKMAHILPLCAERTGGVVLPVNWIGAPGYGSFCGTLTYDADFVKDLFKRTFAQCAKVGAKVIVLVSGHYGAPQENAAKDAASEFMSENEGVHVIARSGPEGVEIDGEKPSDHAGKWETSIALHFFPELMAMGNHEPGEEKIHQYEDTFRFPAEQKPWIWPEDLNDIASAELGKRVVDKMVESVVAQVEEMCVAAGIEA